METTTLFLKQFFFSVQQTVLIRFCFVKKEHVFYSTILRIKDRTRRNLFGNNYDFSFVLLKLLNIMYSEMQSYCIVDPNLRNFNSLVSILNG